MRSTTTMQCSQCNILFEKDNREINRRRKDCGINVPFYCSNSCVGLAFKKPVLTKICPCGTSFETSEITLHCSRGCASRYSFNENRRLVFNNVGINTRFTNDNINLIAGSLRVREWFKYVSIHNFLFYSSIPHFFEFELPGTRYIFDLVLFDLNLLIEFDEKYHVSISEEDKIRDNVANSLGWNVWRIKISPSDPIPYQVNLIAEALTFYD